MYFTNVIFARLTSPSFWHLVLASDQLDCPFLQKQNQNCVVTALTLSWQCWKVCQIVSISALKFCHQVHDKIFYHGCDKGRKIHPRNKEYLCASPHSLRWLIFLFSCLPPTGGSLHQEYLSFFCINQPNKDWNRFYNPLHIARSTASSYPTLGYNTSGHPHPWCIHQDMLHQRPCSRTPPCSTLGKDGSCRCGCLGMMVLMMIMMVVVMSSTFAVDIRCRGSNLDLPTVRFPFGWNGWGQFLLWKLWL